MTWKTSEDITHTEAYFVVATPAFLYTLAPHHKSLLDGLYLLLCELPASTAYHFYCLLLVADANDRASDRRLPENPGNRQVRQLFVLIPGNGLEHCTHLFEPGKGRLLGVGVSPPEILRVQARQVKAVC